MIAVHGDNRGLVIPPRVAKTQVLVVTQWLRSVEESQNILVQVESLASRLSSVGVHVVVDTRDVVSSAWKYNRCPSIPKVGPEIAA